MEYCSVKLQNVYLYIPVFLPGQQRLFRRPAFISSVGATISERRGKFHVNALTNISFEISGGQNLGLLGHNGAGKTSLLRVMAGIYPPSEGRVETNGSIGSLIEMSTGLSAEMTGNEAIKNQVLLNGNADEPWEVIAEEIASFTELGSYLDLPTRTYSNGMRARLVAALATAWQHEILLVDEGIGAGDQAFHEKFAVRLESYLQEASLLVVASHNVDLLRSYCSLGMVLSRGEIVFYGEIEDAIEFYRSPLYTKAVTYGT